MVPNDVPLELVLFFVLLKSFIILIDLPMILSRSVSYLVKHKFLFVAVVVDIMRFLFNNLPIFINFKYFILLNFISTDLYFFVIEITYIISQHCTINLNNSLV